MGHHNDEPTLQALAIRSYNWRGGRTSTSGVDPSEVLSFDLLVWTGGAERATFDLLVRMVEQNCHLSICFVEQKCHLSIRLFRQVEQNRRLSIRVLELAEPSTNSKPMINLMQDTSIGTFINDIFVFLKYGCTTGKPNGVTQLTHWPQSRTINFEQSTNQCYNKRNDKSFRFYTFY